MTDDERAELEMLRAEKARREAEERARQERAELEELRAAQAHRAAAQASAEKPASRSVRTPTSTQPAPDDRTFGQRMVLSDDEDEDGMPVMPPAQRIIIAICIIAVIIAAVYVALSNTGMIG